MRVLLLNEYYPPDTSATASLAASAVDALIAAGHEVRVVAGWPSYQPLEPWPWRPARRQVDADGLRVLRLGSTSFDRRSLRARLANYLTYCAAALPVSLAEPADVVLSMTDPPFVGVLAATVAWARRLPFAYWVQDLYPDVAVATGVLRAGRSLAGSWERAHRWTLGRASRIAVLGLDMAQRVARAGANPGAIRVVHNGADLGPEPEQADRDHPVARRVRSGYDFVALHAGNLGAAGSWEPLIEAAQRLGPRSGLVFLGGGAGRHDLMQRWGHRPGITFLDPLPPSDARWFMAAADICVVALRRGFEGLVVPSKIYGVLAAGRPVLALADDRSELARIVSDHSVGLVADPADPVAIGDALAWAETHPDELAQLGRRARAAAATYDRQLTMRQLAAVVEEAAAERQGSGR